VVFYQASLKFFQNGRLQIKSLILFLCLVKLDEIIVEQKDYIVIDIRLDDNQMQCR